MKSYYSTWMAVLMVCEAVTRVMERLKEEEGVVVVVLEWKVYLSVVVYHHPAMMAC